MIAFMSAVAEPMSGEDANRTRLEELIGIVCRSTIRATDTIGRIGMHGFLCVAPDADAQGAQTIVSRVRSTLEDPSTNTGCRTALLRLRAGYCAASSLPNARFTAVDMLLRAVKWADEAALGQTVGECI